MTAKASIVDLPNEVLQQILYYIEPRDTLRNVSLSSKRFAELVRDPLLWRHYCGTKFTYWDARHDIETKYKANVTDVDWKALYLYRQNADEQTTETFEHILDSQAGRIQRYEDIAEYGYDSKDTLLRHCQVDHLAMDPLSRK